MGVKRACDDVHSDGDKVVSVGRKEEGRSC